MATVTVAGIGGQTIDLSISTSANLQLAEQLAAQISAGVQSGSLTVRAGGGVAPPPLPPGTQAEYVMTSRGAVFLSPGYDAVVNTAHSPTIFGSGDAGESVLSGSTGMTFVAPGGSGTVVAGGGRNTVITLPQDTGAWQISTGNGNDSIYALGSGNDTIQPGSGDNFLVLGSGQDSVQLAGHDTVIATTGSDTIDASNAKSVRLIDSSAKVTFLGGGGSATLFGGNGSLTVQGGSGSLLVHGGIAGNNSITGGTGHATLYGGGSGDQLFAQGGQSQLLRAGAGNETLSGLGSTGNDTFAAGAGRDLLIGGSGKDTFVAGSGNATMQGGSGADTFTFVDGHAGGQTLITGFGGMDKIDLQGYGPHAIADALKTQQQTADGSVTITLADHSTVTFAGISSLSAHNFISGSQGNPHPGSGGGDQDWDDKGAHGVIWPMK